MEAVEIGDKEAEESPVESEEDDAADDGVLLENKDNRKDRLKRLLQERSKRISDEKENQPTKESEVSTVGDKSPQKNENDIAVKEPEADGKAEKHGPNAPISCNVTETLSLSDNSKDLESDIDELHLLQKLHSENEAGTSSHESSDSESPIAISDSYESDNESYGKKQLSDVISIENSSFSESELDVNNAVSTQEVEIKQCDKEMEKNDAMEAEQSNEVIEFVCSTSEGESSQKNITKSTESSNTGILATQTETNVKENKGPDENILLASSDEENNHQEENITLCGCVNIRDDLISIDETVVGNGNELADTDIIESLIIKESIEKEDESVLGDGNKDTEKANEDHVVENDRSQDNLLSKTMEPTENMICVISDVKTSVIDTNKDLSETDNGDDKLSEKDAPSTLSVET